MAEVYAGVNDEILINMARYFSYFGQDNFPRSTFEYQSRMLAQMGQVNRDTLRIIRRNLRSADGKLRGVLEQSIIDAVAKDEPSLLKAVRAGILKPAGIPMVSPQQSRAFQLYYQQSCDKLNMVNTVMLESTQQAYQATVSDIVNRVSATQGALNIATGETVTGVSSWNQAVKHATDRLKVNGITGFIDHAGRHWSAEAYVAMDIRTTVYNTARSAIWETNQDFGNDLYLVSYHNGARPLCYDWQNKVISSTDNARETFDLENNPIRVYAQSETTYGEAAGLFGINCKHYPTPFIPGVSVIRGEPQNPEENERTYKESQEQRRLERQLREDKRDLAMMKAQGAPEEAIKAQQEKVRQSSRDIDDFCDATGRTRQRSREGVYTGRSFPDPSTYDVSTFERNQKDMIEKYFTGGGAQQGYTFGQMQPKTPQLMTEQDYDAKIQQLRDKRFAMFESGNYDKKETDRLLDEIFDLQDKKAAYLQGISNSAQTETPQGVYTLKDATVTRAPFVVNSGTTSQINLQDADIYTMPDGKQFVFKHGMNKEKQPLTPEEVVKYFYSTPQGLRDKAQGTVCVVDRYNPNDAYWRKKYKDFQHSYMTGGKNITIYRNSGASESYVKFSLEHEMGHGLDEVSGRVSDSQEWIEAMAKDKEHSGLDSMRDYGKNSRSEDFADSVGYYIDRPDKFRESMPNRAAILDRYISEGGGSQ